ncbi:hypothetical protein B0H12DRAFT_1115484 [Mycena haematopus]|nr:hypothetical protein B0H12DRAFT_1115484 [Mycena haematopus]
MDAKGLRDLRKAQCIRGGMGSVLEYGEIGRRVLHDSDYKLTPQFYTRPASNSGRDQTRRQFGICPPS